MKKTLLAALLAGSTLVPAVFAGTAKTYQVTGPVVEATADKIVVMKGKDKWELGRDANTKVAGDLKPGAKVTVQYTMTATDVEAKADAAAKATKPAAKAAAH